MEGKYRGMDGHLHLCSRGREVTLGSQCFKEGKQGAGQMFLSGPSCLLVPRCTTLASG